MSAAYNTAAQPLSHTGRDEVRRASKSASAFGAPSASPSLLSPQRTPGTRTLSCQGFRQGLYVEADRRSWSWESNPGPLPYHGSARPSSCTSARDAARFSSASAFGVPNRLAHCHPSNVQHEPPSVPAGFRWGLEEAGTVARAGRSRGELLSLHHAPTAAESDRAWSLLPTRRGD